MTKSQNSNSTIAAISTGSSPTAIGIIRLSGPDCLEIACKVLSKNNTQITKDYILKNVRKSIFCDLVDKQAKIDQILFTFFQAPHSYTGEDLCEFSLHGNPVLLKTAINLIFQHNARPATPGEFTKRAYLNQKLDINQTEAISRLISARSEFELELAQKNLFGEISKLASRIRSELINLKAETEAEIDFSTEDLTFEDLNQRKTRMYNLHKLVSDVLSKSERASKIIQETKIVIYGRPNTGKSSLMNYLLGKERAIISEIPGTTRDYLSESLVIDGISVQLVDTAGVRNTEDQIEKLGIERSEREFANAQIRLFLFDTSVELDIFEFIIENETKLSNSIIVANKIDFASKNWTNYQKVIQDKNYTLIPISCKTGEGIENLLNFIHSQLMDINHREEYILLEDRNKYLFNQIQNSLMTCINLMTQNTVPEIYIKEIDDALEYIGQVNGRVDTEEILGRIFSKFCIGK